MLISLYLPVWHTELQVHLRLLVIVVSMFRYILDFVYSIPLNLKNRANYI